MKPTLRRKFEAMAQDCNEWDWCSLFLLIFTQLVIVGLFVVAVSSHIWTVWTSPLPFMSPLIVVPFLPFVGFPFFLAAVIIQHWRDVWWKWWNVAYGWELLLLPFVIPFVLAVWAAFFRG